MNFKNLFAAAAITILPSHAAAENKTENKDNIENTKTEIVTDTVQSRSDTTPINSVTVENTKNIPADSLAPDSLKSDSIAPLSEKELYQKRLELLRESKKDMLLLIAHFENIKANAEYSNGKYYVGLGFAFKKDGSRVGPNTTIHSEPELMDYWERFTEEKLFPIISKRLKVEYMDHQERVAMTSIIFNRGPKFLDQLDKTINAFVETRDSVYLNKMKYSLMHPNNKPLTGGLKKRRDVELRIFSHELILTDKNALAAKQTENTNTNDSTGLSENSFVLDDLRLINLDEVKIGATYSIGELPKDSTILAQKLRECNAGKSYRETIQKEFGRPKKSTTQAPRPQNNNRGR